MSFSLISNTLPISKVKDESQPFKANLFI